MKKAASVLGRVFLGFILFLTLVPFYLLLSNSFKWSEEIVKKPFTLPAEWHFTNYAKSVVQVIHPMANTLLVTICVIVIVLIVGTLAAYTFVRFHFKGSTLRASDPAVHPDHKTSDVQYFLGTDLSAGGRKLRHGDVPSSDLHGRPFQEPFRGGGYGRSRRSPDSDEDRGTPFQTDDLHSDDHDGTVCLEQLSLAAGFHNGRKYPADRSSADQTGPLFRRRKRNHVCRLCDGITSADPAVLFRK